jgi:hypothetical protein
MLKGLFLLNIHGFLVICVQLALYSFQSGDKTSDQRLLKH